MRVASGVLVVVAFAATGCHSFTPWVPIATAPRYDVTKAVRTRTVPEVRLAMSSDGAAVVVDAQAKMLCSDASFGRMRTVESREKVVSDTAKTGWGIGSVGLVGGAIGLGADWAGDPQSGAGDARVIAAGALLAAGIVGFVTSPETVLGPTVVEGREQFGAPVSKWAGEEGICPGGARTPIAGRRVHLFASIAGGDGLSWTDSTDATGRASLTVGATVRALVYWCGATKLEAKLDQTEMVSFDRGDPDAPHTGELPAATPSMTVEKAPQIALSSIASSGARVLAEKCAAKSHAACLKSSESLEWTWRRECLGSCLVTLELDECKKRRDNCFSIPGTDAGTCDEMATKCVSDVGEGTAFNSCRTKCESKKKEAACPAPQ